MNRRKALAALAAMPLVGHGHAAEAVPSWWKSRSDDIDEAVHRVKKGTTRVLTRSAGKRAVHLVTYGERRRGASYANYNSACAGGDPASYARKDGKQPPTVFLLGPVHGAELEGTVGLLHLLEVAETGRDGRGRPWKTLADNVARCRVLIVPCGNPDGRDRCPYDCWVGEELDSHDRVNMGVKPDGESYRWPAVKRVHPMRPAAYRTLGAYFTDDGVNLMHDEWFDPLAAETRAYLRLAREEAPDFIVSLHSHAGRPGLEPTAYVPHRVKVTIKQLAERVAKRYAEAGLPARVAPEAREDGIHFPPPSFNLCSALHHASGGVAFVHECALGVRTAPYPRLSHDQVLDIQLLMFDELFQYAADHPAQWTDK